MGTKEAKVRMAGTIKGMGVLGATIAQSAAPASVAAPSPTVLAMVDMERLINNLNEIKDRNAAIAKLREEYRTQLEDMDRRVKGLEAELKDSIPASDRVRRMEKSSELVEAREAYRLRTTRFQSLVESKNADVIRDLYNKAQTTIASIAEREGYDAVVLDDQKIVIPEGGTESQVTNVILSRRILYAKKGVDITDRLLAQMNAEYTPGSN
jgi:Skp family chaperone for outer membrane proteins